MKRCTERVWDNGDMTDCGNELPCKQHPPEQVEARRQLEEVHRVIDAPFKHGETYVDRLKAIAKVIR